MDLRARLSIWSWNRRRSTRKLARAMQSRWIVEPRRPRQSRPGSVQASARIVLDLALVVVLALLWPSSDLES